ncbi:MAG: hypothetical protein EOP06_02415 [Proteobacteria bacterium]|nr:MAG: hypothetical protein EOP06_02415 [Pseudomonadota bacterium]
MKQIASKRFNWDGSKVDDGRVLLQRIGSEVGRTWRETMWVVLFGRSVGVPSIHDNPDYFPISSLTINQISNIYKVIYDEYSDALSLGKQDLITTYGNRCRVYASALLDFGICADNSSKELLLIQELTKLMNFYKNSQHVQPISPMEFEKEIEISIAYRSVQSKEKKEFLIIPDVRFQSEIDFITSAKGVIVEVRRNTQFLGDQHVSETSQYREAADIVIENNSSKKELHIKLDSLVDLLQTRTR